MNESHGLQRAGEICLDRSKRARELKAQGKLVIGHYCCHVPREVFTAGGLVPVRITGDIDEPITEADNVLETCMCPYVRSTVDLALKGRYDFLDGIVIPHTCDSVERIANLWRHYFKKPFFHFLNIPHMTYSSSFDFFRHEIQQFQDKVEVLTGRRITASELAGAIALHNENRALTKQMYILRKQDPPLITGHEVLTAVLAGTVIPVEEHNQLLRQIISEVQERKSGPQAKRPRILLYASELDDPRFIDLVESAGSYVVMDDMCIGTRGMWDEVKVTADPLEGLAEGYLKDIHCPRTYVPGQQAKERLQFLVDWAREFNVDGVILLITRYCDTHEFDAPEIRDLMKSNGFPVLHLDHEYSVTARGQFQTRIEAFFETIR